MRERRLNFFSLAVLSGLLVACAAGPHTQDVLQNDPGIVTDPGKTVDEYEDVPVHGLDSVPDSNDIFVRDQGSGEGLPPGDMGTDDETAVDAMFDEDHGGPVDAMDDALDVRDSGEIQVQEKCAAGQACNMPLEDDGTCPGQCIDQHYGLRCPGQVVDSLCLPKDVEVEHGDTDKHIGALYVKVVKQPDISVIGDVKDLQIDITNTSDAPVKTAFGFKNPGTWQILDSNFGGLTSITLGPHEKKSLTARIKAVTSNVLDPMKAVFSFIIGNGVFEPYAVVGLPPGQGIECGGVNFPSRIQGSGPKDYFRYRHAVCCDGVFFPGAYCCTNQDCDGVACIDGHCIDSVPLMPNANVLARGDIRVLMVIADNPDTDGFNPCIDSSDVLTRIPFDQVKNFYKGMLRKETGLEDVNFQLRVAAGVDSSMFVDGHPKPMDYFDAFKPWFARQCGVSTDDFDKKIVVSGIIDLQGYAGMALKDGWVAVHSYERASLLAHELGHTFGATDLYINMGGRFQYARALMGNYPVQDLTPSAALLMVMRGELGMTDADLDGVIDIVEFAKFPDKLDIKVKATLVKGKGTLEITPMVAAIENDVQKRVALHTVNIDIPDLGIVGKIISNITTAFPLTSAQVTSLQKEGRINMAVNAQYSFTNKDFKRKTLKFAQNITVLLGIKQ